MAPVVALDAKKYKLVQQLDAAFAAGTPSLIGCDRLTITGPVKLAGETTFKVRARHLVYPHPLPPPSIIVVAKDKNRLRNWVGDRICRVYYYTTLRTAPCFISRTDVLRLDGRVYSLVTMLSGHLLPLPKRFVAEAVQSNTAYCLCRSLSLLRGNLTPFLYVVVFFWGGDDGLSRVHAPS